MLPGAAAADWLVVRGASPIETDGPWEVRGRLVVFRAADGAMSSLRLADVDIEASTQATAAATRQAKERAQASSQSPEERPKAEIVWTDRDFPRVHVSRTDSDDEDSEAEEDPSGTAELQVTAWEDTPTSDPPGIEVTGTLRNQSEGVAASISLTVVLQNRNGGLIGNARAQLQSSTLMPGKTTRFRAAFPGIFGFHSPRFRPQATQLVAGAEDDG